MNLLDTADLNRIVASQQLDPKIKSALGQYFTPAPTSRFMASLFSQITGDVELLEPGAGVGSLVAAFVEETQRREQADSLSITAYEIEGAILTTLEQTLARCVQSFEDRIQVVSNCLSQDFIVTAADALQPIGNRKRLQQFTHIIVNPPYKKINSSSQHRKLLSVVGIETVNLYSAFVALALKLLRPFGELVAIIPRSFCNGPYYEPFRKLLFAETAVQHIHVFDSRDSIFVDDEVLQENIIVHCIKGAGQGEVTISSSPSAEFYFDEETGSYTAQDMTVRQVEFDQIVRPGDKMKIIHIARTSSEQAIFDRLSVFQSTLDELDLSVSTGPVVDFRLKDDLRQNLEEDTVPLIYPIHLNSGIHWPLQSKKPNAIRVSDDSRPSLWSHEGCFIVTKRFTSKEEVRRISATFYDSSLPGELIGFDNKLNVFHRNKKGVDRATAKGLFVYLNCTLLDRYYRQFGGHTQVNATDLRFLKYPSQKSLIQMGEQVKNLDLSQEEINRIVDGEINLIADNIIQDPLAGENKINQAVDIIKQLGLPRGQQNERSALTLLALLNLRPNGSWDEIEMPMLGVTPIMDWSRQVYGKEYAPNTRETFRRQTLHQFVDAAIVVYNPDRPDRPVNSPKACYQMSPETFDLLQKYDTAEWRDSLRAYLANRPTLVERYANRREMKMIQVKIDEGVVLNLTPGKHSMLIKLILDEFASRFAPGSELIYVGDTGQKSVHFRVDRLAELGVKIDPHGKMPDVVLYLAEKNWLLLVEAVTSHGPVNPKRHEELKLLFGKAIPGLIFVTAFLDKKTLVKYLPEISWETEVWVAETPTHLIHFDGERFLGPYE